MPENVPFQTLTRAASRRLSRESSAASSPTTPSVINTNDAGRREIPGNRGRRGANAGIPSQPEPIAQLPGGANDQQGRLTPSGYLDPFANTVRTEGQMFKRDMSQSISPCTIPLIATAPNESEIIAPVPSAINSVPHWIQGPEPLESENTAADLIDLINEDHERYGPWVPPPGLDVMPEIPQHSPIFVELCTSPSCPVSRSVKHDRGLFLQDGIINPRSQDDEQINAMFGASNPPPHVWEAVNRVYAGVKTPQDLACIHGFARHHRYVLLSRDHLLLDVDGDGMVDFGDGKPIFPPRN